MIQKPRVPRSRDSRRQRGAIRGSLAAAAALVVLLGAGLVAGDQAARRTAEDAAARELQEKLALTTRPQVAIHDTAFLLSLLRSNIGSATVSGDSVRLTYAGRSLTVSRLVAELGDVALSNGTATRIGSLDGSVLLAWDQLTAVTGLQLTAGTDGRVRAPFEFQVLGRTARVEVSALPSVQSGQLVFSEPRVEAGGQAIASNLQSLLLSRLTPIQLQLPFGLRVTSGSASAAGLVLNVSGTDLDLTKI